MLYSYLTFTHIQTLMHASETGVAVVSTQTLAPLSLMLMSERTAETMRVLPVFSGVSVLLWNLHGAYLQRVQHGPSHGPHFRLPARRRSGLPGHHHPAAGRCTAGTTGGAGRTATSLMINSVVCMLVRWLNTLCWRRIRRTWFEC